MKTDPIPDPFLHVLPRMTDLLTPEVEECIERLARATGVSVSRMTALVICAKFSSLVDEERRHLQRQAAEPKYPAGRPGRSATSANGSRR